MPDTRHGRGESARDSKPNFFPIQLRWYCRAREVEQENGSRESMPVTFAARLSVVTAYVALAFVAAIILGLI